MRSNTDSSTRIVWWRRFLPEIVTFKARPTAHFRPRQLQRVQLHTRKLGQMQRGASGRTFVNAQAVLQVECLRRLFLRRCRDDQGGGGRACLALLLILAVGGVHLLQQST